ncbi:type II toxin-antitoxin system RelB/DinJ family antitoxin, partial [Shigella sonnei]|uniref:type II toxin-antitoxin system RelB/DinJ family antitoxin n=1 Tax=Shigella sonnei TaxID=624 RepID=UPI0020927EEA
CSFELQFKLNKYTAQEIPQWLLTRLFAPLREPNQLTIQSIKNSEAGVDVHKAKDADDLFDKLGI